MLVADGMHTDQYRSKDGDQPLQFAHSAMNMMQAMRHRREREKLAAAEVTEPLLDPRVELDAVLDEVDSIVNTANGHVHPAAGDSDDKVVIAVPYHPTMKHDEYVKGAPLLQSALASASKSLADFTEQDCT